MNADASSGPWLLGNPNPEVGCGSRGAGGPLLVCLSSTTSRAHSETKQNLAQRAKVGYCPCCVRATHVATPPAFSLAEYDALRVTDLALSEQFRP